PWLDRITLVQRVHLEVLEAVDPLAVVAALPGALLDDGDRLVDPAEERVLALEHLHHHARVVVVGLQQLLRVVEVRVGVVAVADLVQRQAEDRGRQALLLAGAHEGNASLSRGPWTSSSRSSSGSCRASPS